MRTEQRVERYKRDLVELLSKTYGPRLEKVLESLGKPPKKYAVRVNTLRTSVDEALERFSEAGVECSPHEEIGEAILLDISGPHPITCTGKVVTAKKHAAESVMLGSNLYLPGVMRMERVKVGDRTIVVDPRGNTVASGRTAVHSGIRGAEGIAVFTEESIYRLPAIRESSLFLEGKIQEQSLPAIYTTVVLDPQPGETVIDMCAAPGGKASHIAQLQNDCGRVLAFEHSPGRVDRMKRVLSRLGIRSVRVERADARYLDRDYPSLRADRVLVDPPCTALGVRPKLYEEAGAAEVLSSAEFQKQFLRAAVNVLKPGGILVYSTCTLSYEENEGVVRFAEDELNLELDEPPLRLAGAGEGIGYSECVRFDPDRYEAPGYFIARFRRSR
ncbi:MAG: methyltransferase domain-containing protein [Candidatus Verstraetearchaeota archaeon]|nr:methyltransferase domain-containing protein [Candidatus Verstraetearchaeota archaeon]